MTKDQFQAAVTKLPLFQPHPKTYPGYDPSSGRTYLHKGEDGQWSYVTRAVLEDACRHFSRPQLPPKVRPGFHFE